MIEGFLGIILLIKKQTEESGADSIGHGGTCPSPNFYKWYHVRVSVVFWIDDGGSNQCHTQMVLQCDSTRRLL